VEPARVEIDLGFFPLMWFLFFIRPWLAVNGQAERTSWGKHQLTLAPGSYYFEAWYPYIFRARTSNASLRIELVAGGVYQIKYRPPWIVLFPGKMTVVSQPQLPPATARQLPSS
jgi:hypothetical protein